MRQLTKEKAAKKVSELLQERNLDYRTLMDIVGNVIVQKNLGGCPSDFYMLLYDKKSETPYGVIGWGLRTCSGCDALQACGFNVDRIVELLFSLRDDIMWKTGDELLAWINAPARKNDVFHFVDKKGFKSFLRMCTKAVNKRKKKTDDALLKITHKLVSSISTSETKVEINFQSAKEYEQFFADWLVLIKKYKNKNA